MLAQPSSLQKIKLNLYSIRLTIQQLLASWDYERISKSYKQISTQLMYFLKCPSDSLSPQLKANLADCFKNLHSLLKSTEFEKYGHRFPLLGNIVRKYEQNNELQVSSANSQIILRRIEKNQQSRFFNSLRMPQICSHQLGFLASPDLNYIFQAIARNQLVLQNSQCVCCSQVFIRDFPIRNYNLKVRHIVSLPYLKGIDQAILSRYLNALANAGGGVILAGANIKDGQLRAFGIKMKDDSETMQKQTQIYEAFKVLSPGCQFQVKKVLVHTNFMVNMPVQNEYKRYCFRISALPREARKIHYVQVPKKVSPSVFEVYDFDHAYEPVKVISKSQNNSLYYYMLSKYKNGVKNQKDSHQNIKCMEPHQENSLIYQSFLQKGLIMEANLHNLEKNEEIQMEQAGTDEPVFKFKNTSLLAVPSQKFDRQIEQFTKAYKSTKAKFVFSRPFKKAFKNCTRVFQLLSHQAEISNLKKFLIQFETNGFVKRDTVSIIPVQRNLQIDRAKLSQYNEKIFEKKFMEHYGQLYKKETAEVGDKNSPKTIVYFYFNDLSEAIFAYMIFEELNLRPYFVKESSVNYQLQKQ